MDLQERKERMDHLVLLATQEDQERRETKVLRVEMDLQESKVKEAKMVFKGKEVRLVQEDSEADLVGQGVRG